MWERDERIRDLKRLYRNLGYVSAFVHWRCWHTPYLLLEELAPREGRIIDLGCGYGLFANLLALTSSKRKVLGMDISKRKLQYADRGLANAAFQYGDAMTARWDRCQGISLVHLLHHLSSYEDQTRLLRLCFESLDAGGSLVVLEVDKRPRWKYALAQVVDNVAYPFDRFYFRSRAAFESLLQSVGFRNGRFVPGHQGVPLSHMVLVAQK